jgi:ketosteroid isomerase-like protein
MRQRAWAAVACAMIGCGAPRVASDATTRPAPSRVEAECAVWDAERAFASAVARHDEAAFAASVHEAALFRESDGAEHRGRAAIVESWRPLIEGKGAQLRWYPNKTQAIGDGRVVRSSGPFLFTATGKDGAPRAIVGAFDSVWQLGADGSFRVIFDGPAENAHPATAEELAAFEAGASARCPAGEAKR